jgi:hypothetical protein
VLSITGPQQYESVLEAVHRRCRRFIIPHLDLVPPQGVKLTPRHYAYLKISEGCNNRCSFCIIPKLRGDLVSRPANDVLREAEKLGHCRRQGIAGHLAGLPRPTASTSNMPTARGRTARSAPEFFDLAKELGDLGAWVRLQYVYPYPHVDEVIGLMTEGKVLPYLDIPSSTRARSAQGDEAPGRAGKDAGADQEVARAMPDLTLRSTFIVGFPGETDSDLPICSTGSKKPRSIVSAASNTSRSPGALERDRQRRARRDQAGALERADGAAAENLGAASEAQGRHAAADHHRRGRPDGRKRPFKGRRAADRRRGLSVQPPPAEGRRDRHAKIERATNTTCTAASPGSEPNQRPLGHPPAFGCMAVRHETEPDQPPAPCLRRRSSDDGLRKRVRTTTADSASFSNVFEKAAPSKVRPSLRFGTAIHPSTKRRST